MSCLGAKHEKSADRPQFMFCLQKIGITREKGTIEKNIGLKPGLEPGFLGMQVIVQENETETIFHRALHVLHFILAKTSLSR